MPGPSHVPASPPNSPAPAAPWLWAALGLCVAAFVLILLVALDWRPVLRTDTEVAGGLHARALAHPAWVEANRVLTDWVWDPVTMRLLLGAAALWTWLRRERLLAVWCVATSAAGTGIEQGLKAALGRDRPRWRHPVDTANFASMPSGHAMTAAVTCTMVLWLVHRYGVGARVWELLVALGCVSVAGVSFTRIALGVHWLSDTVVGSLLGVAVAAASIGLWNALVHRVDQRGQDAPGI